MVRLKRLPVIATLITLTAVVIMSLLGLWQLDRGEQKALRLAQIEARAASPLSLAELLSKQGDFADWPVSARGQLDTGRVFLIDNKTWQGKVGYQVLVPLEIENGLIITNLGWVAAGNTRASLPELVFDNTAGVWHGFVSLPQANPMVRETITAADQWPVVLQQPDLALMEQMLNAQLLPMIMIVNNGQGLGLPQTWQPVVMPPEKHLAYAIQWFGLALASLLVYLFALKSRKESDHD